MRMFFDHTVLAIIIISVSVFLLVTSTSPLVGSVLYFGLPSLYLVLRKPCIFKRVLAPTFIFGLVYAIGFEYLNEVGGSWVFPLAHTFVFPELFFNIVPGDVIVWYVLWAFTVVAYYEYFFDRHTTCTLVYRRIYKALGLGLFALGIIAVAEYLLHIQIVIPFAYTVTGLAAFIPVFILYKRKPAIFSKLIKTIPFLALFFLLMEFVALTVGYWEFTGDSLFMFWIGGHTLPVEEIIFWILASPLVISAYHELFLDDEV